MTLFARYFFSLYLLTARMSHCRCSRGSCCTMALSAESCGTNSVMPGDWSSASAVCWPAARPSARKALSPLALSSVLVARGAVCMLSVSWITPLAVWMSDETMAVSEGHAVRGEPH